MARPRTPVDKDPFGDEVTFAWSRTTKPQREKVLEDWGNGDYHLTIAKLLYLNPDALLLAACLEFGHPCVCDPSGRPKGTHYGKLCAMMKAFVPVDKPPISVDKPVDKSVDNPVDNFTIYPLIHREPLI